MQPMDVNDVIDIDPMHDQIILGGRIWPSRSDGDIARIGKNQIRVGHVEGLLRCQSYAKWLERTLPQNSEQLLNVHETPSLRNWC